MNYRICKRNHDTPTICTLINHFCLFKSYDMYNIYYWCLSIIFESYIEISNWKAIFFHCILRMYFYLLTIFICVFCLRRVKRLKVVLTKSYWRGWNTGWSNKEVTYQLRLRRDFTEKLHHMSFVSSLVKRLENIWIKETWLFGFFERLH